MARTARADAGGRRPDPAALLPPLARRADRDEGVHGAPELLDRRGLLPRLLRAARTPRPAGAVLGHHGVHLGLRPGGRARLAATHGQPQGVRRAAVRHAARLPAVLAPAGPHLPDDHLAGDALLGGGLHDRADAGLFGESQHRAGDVPLPLGADRTFEGLLLRHSGGLPAGMQHRPGAVPLLPRIHPRQRRAVHETLAAGAQRAARGDVPDHRVLLRCCTSSTSSPTADTPHTRKKSARPTGRFFFLRQTPPIRCGAGPTCCWRR